MSDALGDDGVDQHCRADHDDQPAGRCDADPVGAHCLHDRPHGGDAHAELARWPAGEPPAVSYQPEYLPGGLDALWPELEPQDHDPLPGLTGHER